MKKSLVGWSSSQWIKNFKRTNNLSMSLPTIWNKEFAYGRNEYGKLVSRFHMPTKVRITIETIRSKK
jgi:hypothetical protein